MKHFILALRILAAVILFQTLFFKFSGAPESVYIFTQLHAEPFGRWFAGLSELIAGVLLLIPATQSVGALAAIGIMMGALLSHLFVLGINVQDDKGLLFSLAMIVLVSSIIIVANKRDQLLDIKDQVLKKMK